MHPVWATARQRRASSLVRLPVYGDEHDIRRKIGTVSELRHLYPMPRHSSFGQRKFI